MNVNKEIIELLGTATALPVAQDEYEGTSSSYLIFIYEDETPDNYADNKANCDTVYLQIQLITPKNYNYMNLKHIIRNALENNDWIVTSIQSFLGDAIQGTEKIRQTIFKTNLTRSR
ncbi:MAG: hypothetical protein KBT03_12785 [Bacteroidales bacterium]|nr:hypothetical protein [Candidatus Scybalousia scybalohippi]